MKLSIVILLFCSFAQAEGKTCGLDLSKIGDKILVSMAEGNKLGHCSVFHGKDILGHGKEWHVRLNRTSLSEYGYLTLPEAASALRELAATGACDPSNM